MVSLPKMSTTATAIFKFSSHHVVGNLVGVGNMGGGWWGLASDLGAA